jgi:hypothetical protein
MGDAATSILPRAIAGGILRSENATGGAIRIRAFGIPDENSLESLEAVARAAKENVSDVYEAQVILGPSGVELLRKSTTLDSAPIENRAPAENRAPDQNPSRGSAASSTAPPAAAAPLQPGAQP